MGLLLDDDLCHRLMHGLATQATEHQNFIRIDMEDSECTEKRSECILILRRSFSNIGIVVQAYLRRTDASVIGPLIADLERRFQLFINAQRMIDDERRRDPLELDVKRRLLLRLVVRPLELDTPSHVRPRVLVDPSRSCLDLSSMPAEGPLLCAGGTPRGSDCEGEVETASGVNPAGGASLRLRMGRLCRR